ncbi:conserved exported hypothetical protein [Xenorhabdus nematophila F1]|uniref:Uncharacterized protein n=1 Tax=Xenorhabdus nematophila (strain ATCC 19061 / DSM 3370 / CCUG 14189 / LMG 1036 / NCIMB 9965 / AN6) TaxID=406817 RepID=D3VF40_XENNA|nr:hypothetical protein D3790_16405 [Xenorhabdus nematophila]CBJ92497.1 hypothetical protein XNC1_4475 [Xenorhabdus nematophila ATCC 19061]CCW31338.1 conserved exported hypothetical protein [Xenorhabdus nematophila F1]CEE90963.1 hypothetical protein XNA1_1840026 [Xenorhabdus nematophila str. Anatoliense]CEF29133.1 hypothetical protein XNW1_1570025 [Xenorhabdus nematophila str. Websteri]CEK25311.1 hypothetical protein XNC2_4324 [Xenorhabdus nematophila AN6/1]
MLLTVFLFLTFSLCISTPFQCKSWKGGQVVPDDYEEMNILETKILEITLSIYGPFSNNKP